MKNFEAIPALNRLLGLLCRSLPAYLADAKPWGRADRRQVRAALEHLLADRQSYARRVAEAILARGGRPHPGPFPAEFAAKNDLALEFLFREVIEYQERDVLSIERCAVELEGDPALHSLAEEILGNTKGHLDLLKELLKNEG